MVARYQTLNNHGTQPRVSNHFHSMTNRNSSSNRERVIVNVVLAIGFIALAIGILQADARQATGYELSIYGGTPLGFWIAVATALAISLVVSFAVRPGWVRTAALLLGGLAVLAIAALPVLRGYYYHGTADALTHLGWTRDIATGAIGPTELFYPGIHTFSVVFSSFTGIGITRAVLYVVAIMAAVALVFVPLAVRAVTRDEYAVVVASFSAFLLFMVHNLGVYLHAHSFAQAVFFTALVLFLLFAYLTRGSTIALGVLLAVVSAAAVLFHPQQAANLILVFGAISATQLILRRYRANHPIAGHRTLYAHTGFLAVAFSVWVIQFEGWAFANFDRVGDAFLAYLAGRPPVAGGSFHSQAASLSAIGAGLPEMFVKMFLVAAVYTILAVALMAASILRIADQDTPTANAMATYLALGSLAVLPVAAAYFAGNIAEHYFRHLGFLLLVAMVVGGIALSRGITGLSSRYNPRWAAVAVVIAFAIMLPLSLATAFPTPFIHKQTQHVTEEQMDGYQTALELNDETLPLGGIRQAPWRYSHAIEGVSETKRYVTLVTNENVTRLREFYDGGGYLVVTDRDWEREVVAYEELRYTDRAFRSLDTQPGVNLVESNGALRMYHVSEDGGEATIGT